MFRFLSWFSHLNPLLSTWIWTGLNNNSSIRRTRSILFPSGKPHPLTLAMKRIATLHQLYQEYQQALRPSGQEKPLRAKPFPRNEDAVTQDLTSLYDKKGDTDTLQDMVAGAPGIDAILDTLDTTGEGEMHWLAMESMPDILQLLSPELGGKTAHSEILPDLTRREHRIIGIDSHYRITPTQKNGNTAHEKN